MHDIQRREKAAGYPTGTTSSGTRGGSSGGAAPVGGASSGFLGFLSGFLGSVSGRASRATSGNVQTYDVTGPGQTVSTSGTVTVQNHGEPGTTFLFDPGHGATTIRQFVVGGDGHDTLSLPQSDFTGIADVLRHTQSTASGAVIHDAATGDIVRLVGVSKADLSHNRQDIAFQG